MKRGTDSPTGQPDDASDTNARVVVAVRIRPLRAESALERYDTSCLYCTAPEGTTAQVEAPTTVTIINPTTKEQTDFAFDRVFDEADGQASVYSELVEDTLLHTIERGGDVTMVAYGQTGSGKTFTMLGERGGPSNLSGSTASSPLLKSSMSSGGLRSPVHAAHNIDWLSPDSGVFLRAVNTLMSYRDLHKGSSHVSIYLQAVEIYNDTFIDLLAKGAHKGDQRQGWQRPNQAPLASSGVIEPREVGENLVLSNALRIPLETLDDVQRCFDISHKNRSVSATNMNDVSSRSHAIFLIEMVMQARFTLPNGEPSAPPDIDAVMEHELQQWMPSAATSGTPAGSFVARSTDASRQPGPQVRSALLSAMVARNPSNDFDLHPLHICRVTLVDLAGSERVKRSGVVGKGMQEAVFVNSSLSTLGLVVHSLCAKQQQSTKHIPFRDSKMTRVLRPSFVSPSAKVIFVTNISPTSQSYVETLNSMRFASRLKDLKYSTPPQTSGPTLGLLLNDERLQRLRQQFDEMSADIRIYHMTSGSSMNGAAAMTSLRRALVEQARSPGTKARPVVEDLLVRPPNVKEALQRCRTEAAATQEASDKSASETRQSILDQMMAAARQSGRINEDETEMTVDHLRDSIARMEAELQLTKSTCSADVQQWRDRVESAEVQGDAISGEYSALVKRKRDLYHDNIKKRTELDDIDEEATVIRRSEQAASSRLAAEQALKNTEMEDSGSDRRTVNTTIEYLDTLLKRMVAATDLHVTLRHLDRLDQQQRDATAPSLVSHELSLPFSHRLAALPLKDLFDSRIVRTSEGRHRLLNERLEQASTIFTVSPIEYYFSPESAMRPTKYVSWDERRRGSTSTNRHVSDNDSDDDLVYDEDLEATAERCASRGPSMQSTEAGSPLGTGPAPQLGASSTSAPLGEQLVEYYLRIMALYGHLMRVTARAEKRKRKLANAPLLSNAEARSIFVILDAVEVDERVVEDILRNAHKQLDLPVTDGNAAARSPHALKSPESEHGIDAWDSNRLPAIASESTKRLMTRVGRLIKSQDVLSVPHLRFVPCFVRCLQALTLISLYEALLSMKLPGGEGGGFQKTLLKKMAKRLVMLQSATETQSPEDAAILKGCQYACRASVGSSGGSWSMDDLIAAEERSRLKERIRIGALASQPAANATPSQPQTALPDKRDDRRASSSLASPIFLWAHPRSCDLSPLRGLATKCLLLSQLLQAADASEDQVPTQPRFLECLLLVLRQGH